MVLILCNLVFVLVFALCNTCLCSGLCFVQHLSLQWFLFCATLVFVLVFVLCNTCLCSGLSSVQRLSLLWFLPCATLFFAALCNTCLLCGSCSVQHLTLRDLCWLCNICILFYTTTVIAVLLHSNCDPWACNICLACVLDLCNPLCRAMLSSSILGINVWYGCEQVQSVLIQYSVPSMPFLCWWYQVASTTLGGGLGEWGYHMLKCSETMHILEEISLKLCYPCMNWKKVTVIECHFAIPYQNTFWDKKVKT